MHRIYLLRARTLVVLSIANAVALGLLCSGIVAWFRTAGVWGDLHDRYFVVVHYGKLLWETALICAFVGATFAPGFHLIFRSRPLWPALLCVDACVLLVALSSTSRAGNWSSFFALIAYGLGLIAVTVFVSERMDAGFCEECDYDIRAQRSAGLTRCPECGLELGRASQRLAQRK